MKAFPKFNVDIQDDVIGLLRYLLKERPNDINDFENLNNVFISGRKVGKIPTGAADITAMDKIGDFNADANFIYIVINNAGTAQWRRSALASW